MLKKTRLVFFCVSIILFIGGMYLFYLGHTQSEQPAFSENFYGDYGNIFNKMLVAAKNGDVIAQVNIANLYAKGLGTEQSYERAYYWYKKAADQENSDAMLGLGIMFNKGYYVKKDYQKAIALYQKAIKVGNNSMAKYNLSIAYFNGTGVRQNYREGIRLLNEAIEQNNTNAMLKLGLAYMKGDYALSKNNKKAFILFKKAAELGDPMGQSNLAAAYFLGKGTEKNDFEAYKWFYIAANYGNDGFARKLINSYEFALNNEEKSKVEQQAKEWMASNKEINQDLIDADYKSKLEEGR